MKILNIKTYLLLLLVLVSSCGESLEDTYKDYAGDGKIRYLSKCSDLTVKSGWERIELRWKNGIDATVTNIKVAWKSNDVTHDTILDKSVEYVNLTNLVDATYEFEVFAINDKGERSISIVNFGKPYTDQHETVRTFTMGVIKHYKLNNSLIMFMDRWNTNIDEINLTYTGTDGVKKLFPLTEEVFNKGLNVLKNVDLTKDIIVDRRGRLEGCEDLITFVPLTLGDQVNISSSFKLELQRHYGLSDLTPAGKIRLEEFLATTQEIELDNDVESFGDLLYCPNLKKLILGKNRYLHPTFKIEASTSVLFERDLSIAVLDILAELLPDLSVEQYADHYLGDLTKPYLIKKEIPTLPVNLTYLTGSDVKTFTNSIPEIPGLDSNLKALLDNDPKSSWEPIPDGYVRQYEINIELKEIKRIDGFKFVQPTFDPETDTRTNFILANLIKIQVSTDMINWSNVTYVDENPLGRGPGEVTLLKMEHQTEVKYIKITLNDQSFAGVFGIKVADIVPYVNN